MRNQNQTKTQEKLEKIGDRIELISSDDPYTRLRIGDRGIITGIDEMAFPIHEDIVQISVDWDSGSSLMLIKNVDKFKIIEVNDES